MKRPLFKDTLGVVNVGLASFAETVTAAGGQCVGVQWQPPAQGDRDGAWALAALLGHPSVERANEQAFARFLEAQPVLTGITTARAAMPAMAERKLLLHAGPPIAWGAMCGPMRTPSRF